MANGIKVGSEANPCIRHVLKGAKKKCAEKISILFDVPDDDQKFHWGPPMETPKPILGCLFPCHENSKRNENLSESHIRDANNCPSSSSL